MVRTQKGISRFFSRTLVFLMVLFASCATVPPAGQNPAYPAGYLRASPLWGRLQLAASPRLKEALAQNESLKDVVNRAQSLWFSVHLAGLHPQSWVLIAQGDYPKGLVGLVLDTKPHWVQEKKTVPQWFDQKVGLWVFLPEDGLVAASSESFTPERATWSPEVFRQVPWPQVHGSGLYLEVQEPAKLLFGEKGARLFPIEKLILRLKAEENDWSGPLELQFKDKQAAEGSLFLLKLWTASQRLGVSEAPNPLLSFLNKVTWSVQDHSVWGTPVTVPYTVVEQFVNKLTAKKGTP